MLATITLKVDGMTCGGCVSSVERAVERVPGVKKARASLEKKEVVVEGEDVDTAKVVDAIFDAGFDVAS